ncbi:DUF3871 family protein [Leeuwenhoekiella parthenopeia]|uniref:DUF3871 family protein n=1 Tax=Leeuwenhoekiella parthenopeia TaxID=2890320 RepID=A0ABS8GUM3_9FLAO|nr:DUF3871 family protein [Leeuwenhoekiella parthenopeia]MCC4212258.1 DUF3871 family protein [Leeuwenhoekiella parthenopeia]
MELQQIERTGTIHQKKNYKEISSSDVLKNPESEKSNSFIKANTKGVSLSHLKEDCVIPVFSKDNEITISHSQFVEAGINEHPPICRAVFSLN